MHRLIEEIEKSKRQINKQLTATRFNRDEVKDSLKSLTESLIDLLNTYHYSIDYLMSLQWWKEVIAIIKNEQKLPQSTLITCLCQWIDNTCYNGVEVINEERMEAMRYISFVKLFNLPIKSKNTKEIKSAISKLSPITAKKKKVDASFFENIAANGKKGETYSKGNVKIRLLTDEEIEQRRIEAKAVRDRNRIEKLKNKIAKGESNKQVSDFIEKQRREQERQKRVAEKKAMIAEQKARKQAQMLLNAKERAEKALRLAEERKEQRKIEAALREEKKMQEAKERIFDPYSTIKTKVIIDIFEDLLKSYTTIEEDYQKYLDQYNQTLKPYNLKTLLKIIFLANKRIPASKIWNVFRSEVNLKEISFIVNEAENSFISDKVLTFPDILELWNENAENKKLNDARERVYIKFSKITSDEIKIVCDELLESYTALEEDYQQWIDRFNQLKKPYDLRTILQAIYLLNNKIPLSKIITYFSDKIWYGTLYNIFNGKEAPIDIKEIIEHGYFSNQFQLIEKKEKEKEIVYTSDIRAGNAAKFQTLQYVRNNMHVPFIPLNLQYIPIVCEEILEEYTALEADYRKYLDEFTHTKAKVDLKALLKAIYLKNKGITETRIETGLKGVITASTMQKIFEDMTLPFSIEDLLQGYYKERIVNMDDAKKYLEEYLNGDFNSDVEIWEEKLKFYYCYLDVKTYLQVIYLLNKGVRSLFISRIVSNVHCSYIKDMEKKLKNHKRPIDIQSLIDAGIIKPLGKNTIIDIEAKKRKEIREKELSSIDEILSGYTNLDADIVKYDKILKNYVRPYKAEMYLKTLYLLANTSLSNQKIMAITKAGKKNVRLMKEAVDKAKKNNTFPMDELLNTDNFKSRQKEVFYNNKRLKRQAKKQVSTSA